MSQLSYFRYPLLIILWVVSLMSGVLSLLRETYTIYSGQLPAKPLFWSCTMVAFIVSAAILWGIEHRTVRQLREEILGARLTPAEVKLFPCELRRAVTEGKDQWRNVFVRVKVSMTGAMRTSVTKCRMELSRDGIINQAQLQNDLASWEITDWSSAPIPNDELRPLPAELTSGNTVEGWLHFTIPNLKDRELDRTDVRLFVDTERGTGSAEVKAGREYWNVVEHRMILPKE